MNVLLRLKNLIIPEKELPPPDPNPKDYMENTFSRFLSRFPGLSLNGKKEDALKKALKLIIDEIKKELNTKLDKLKEFERIFLRELIIFSILIVILLALLYQNGTHNIWAGWVVALLIGRAAEQMAKLPQIILYNPEYKAFLKKVFHYWLNEMGKKLNPVIAIEKIIEQMLRERIESDEFRDNVKEELYKSISSLKLIEWILYQLFGDRREEIYKYLLNEVVKEVPAISREATKLVMNIVWTIFIFIGIILSIRFFALEITGNLSWDIIIFGISYFVIWLLIIYCTRTKKVDY